MDPLIPSKLLDDSSGDEVDKSAAGRGTSDLWSNTNVKKVPYWAQLECEPSSLAHKTIRPAKDSKDELTKLRMELELANQRITQMKSEFENQKTNPQQPMQGSYEYPKSIDVSMLWNQRSSVREYPCDGKIWSSGSSMYWNQSGAILSPVRSTSPEKELRNTTEVTNTVSPLIIINESKSNWLCLFSLDHLSY